MRVLGIGGVPGRMVGGPGRPSGRAAPESLSAVFPACPASSRYRDHLVEEPALDVGAIGGRGVRDASPPADRVPDLALRQDDRLFDDHLNGRNDGN
jgi:hypothetical protein